MAHTPTHVSYLPKADVTPQKLSRASVGARIFGNPGAMQGSSGVRTAYDPTLSSQAEREFELSGFKQPPRPVLDPELETGGAAFTYPGTPAPDAPGTVAKTPASAYVAPASAKVAPEPTVEPTPTAPPSTSGFPLISVNLPPPSLVPEGLHDRLDMFAEIEGSARPNYEYFAQGSSGGAPRNSKEAYIFLDQASRRPASQINMVEITTSAVARAQEIQTISLADKSGIRLPELDWAQGILAAHNLGQTHFYMHKGRQLDISNPADAALINEWNQITAYKEDAALLVSDYRAERKGLFNETVARGAAAAQTGVQSTADKELAKINNKAAEDIAKLEAKSRQKVAMLQTLSAEKTATVSAKAATDVATTKAEASKVVATTAADAAKEVAKTRKLEAEYVADKRKEEAESVVATQGLNAINAIEAELARDKQTIALRATEERATLQKVIFQENKKIGADQANLLIQMDKEEEVQGNLMTMQADLADDEALLVRSWQATEAALSRAIAQGQLDETIRANQALEAIQADQLMVEQEGQKLSFLMNISQNPALLYYMKEAGLLSGVLGDNVMGEDLNDIVSGLTATIDSSNLPNIQDYNAMSQLEQQIAGFSAGATRGMTEEGLGGYLAGSSPFTRGQRSTIRVGSARNPFEVYG